MTERKLSGGILTDRDILKKIANNEITISPLIDAATQVGTASIDLRLGTEFIVFTKSEQSHVRLEKKQEEAELDLRQNLQYFHVKPFLEEKFMLHPGEFALGCTLEYVNIPQDLTGSLQGRSSWARMGLMVHSTAGFVDAGYSGILTLELTNVGRLPIPLYPGLRIAQLSFLQTTSPSIIPYTGRYKQSSNLKGLIAQILDDNELEAIRKLDFKKLRKYVESGEK